MTSNICGRRQVGVDFRFPGQTYQFESGLHYNWHRQYDPTIGRYTQPDPLGLVDGPSRYAYVRNDPLQMVDPEGRLLTLVNPWLIEQLKGLLYPPSPPPMCTASDDFDWHDYLSSFPAEEHTKGARPSTKGKHEAGQARKGADYGGEKGDEGRDPPRKIPPNWKGPWPPRGSK